MKTNLTQKQLEQLAELITLGQYKDGTLFIRDVRGDVHGNVEGNVYGSVYGKIAGKYWTSLAYKEVKYD